MKVKYELEGMSCENCVHHVKQALLQLAGVEEAEVKLNPQTAILTLGNPVNVEELQASISKAGNYSIKEIN